MHKTCIDSMHEYIYIYDILTLTFNLKNPKTSIRICPHFGTKEIDNPHMTHDYLAWRLLCKRLILYPINNHNALHSTREHLRYYILIISNKHVDKIAPLFRAPKTSWRRASDHALTSCGIGAWFVGCGLMCANLLYANGSRDQICI